MCYFVTTRYTLDFQVQSYNLFPLLVIIPVMNNSIKVPSDAFGYDIKILYKKYIFIYKNVV